MNEPSPYQPPMSQAPPSLPLAMTGTPSAVSVFGVLHIVFACLGVLTSVWGLVVAFVGNPFLSLQPAGPQMQAQIAMQSKMNPMTIANSLMALAVAVPMIIAGIKLVKKRHDGLKWSNRYAFSSLAVKAINLVLTVTILLPAMREMTRTVIGDSRVPAGMSGFMSGAMAGGAIIGVVLSAVYPSLSLILLNRPYIKAWFAALQG